MTYERAIRLKTSRLWNLSGLHERVNSGTFRQPPFGGWTTATEFLWLNPGQPIISIPAGGWSMSAASLLELRINRPNDGLYEFHFDGRRVHIGEWNVDELEEQWFHEGDLYRLEIKTLIVPPADPQ